MNSFFASQKKLIIISITIIVLMIGGIIYFIYASKKVINQSLSSQKTEKTESNQDSYQPVSLTPNTDFKKLAQDMEEKVSSGRGGVSEYINLGVSYYNLKQYDKSIDAYVKALNREPENASIYTYLGNVYRDKEDYKAAEKYYLQSIDKDKTFISAYISLAVMKKVLLEDTAGAIEVLNRGLESNPEDGTLKILLEEYNKS